MVSRDAQKGSPDETHKEESYGSNAELSKAPFGGQRAWLRIHLSVFEPSSAAK